MRLIHAGSMTAYFAESAKLVVAAVAPIGAAGFIGRNRGDSFSDSSLQREPVAIADWSSVR